LLLLHGARQQPDGGLRPEPAPCRGPMRGRSGRPARKPSPC